MHVFIEIRALWGFICSKHAVPRYYNRPEARVEIPAWTASLLKNHPSCFSIKLFPSKLAFAVICHSSTVCCNIYPIIQKTDFMTNLPARSSGAPYPHPVHFVIPVILSQPLKRRVRWPAPHHASFFFVPLSLRERPDWLVRNFINQGLLGKSGAFAQRMTQVVNLQRASLLAAMEGVTDLPARSSGAPYPHPVHFVNPVILSQP